MALAPFFDKAALAASTVLQGFDRRSFAETLEHDCVGIWFDEAAVATSAGRTTLELSDRKSVV